MGVETLEVKYPQGSEKQLIQAIIDLQDKISREGTLNGREFASRQQQEPKRALVELPVIEDPRQLRRRMEQALVNSVAMRVSWSRLRPCMRPCSCCVMSAGLIF